MECIHEYVHMYCTMYNVHECSHVCGMHVCSNVWIKLTEGLGDIGTSPGKATIFLALIIQSRTSFYVCFEIEFHTVQAGLEPTV